MTMQPLDDEFLAYLQALMAGPRTFQDGGLGSKTQAWTDGQDTKQGRFSPNAEVEPHEIYPTDTDKGIRKRAHPRTPIDQILEKFLGRTR